MFKVGAYVTHPSKGYPPIYRITRILSPETVEVEYIGDRVNGKLTNFSSLRNRSHRNTSDLSPV